MFSGSVIGVVKRYHRLGFTAKQIQERLSRRLSPAPSVSSIRRWTDGLPKGERRSSPVLCSHCGSSSTISYGLRRARRGLVQRLHCRSCLRSFSFPSPFHRCRYPGRVVTDALIYRCGGVTYSKIRQLLWKRHGVKVCSSVVSSWMKRFDKYISYSDTSSPARFQRKFLRHNQTYWFAFHEVKLEQLAFNYPSLRAYLYQCLGKIPDELFLDGNRCSTFDISKRFDLRMVDDPICVPTGFALSTCQDNSMRHPLVQRFLLNCDAYTVAREVPVWLKAHEVSPRRLPRKGTLSGHIDLLQIRGNKIYIWDYKPNARKERNAKKQLLLYALALSERTNIPLECFMCGYFDEKDCYIFEPHKVYYDHMHSYRFLPQRRRVKAFKKVVAVDNLYAAWEEVKKRRKSLGIDRFSVDEFSKNLDARLLSLHTQLHFGKYIPAPAKRVLIPKPNGKFRPLGIHCVKDKIVQMAVKNVIEVFFEPRFKTCSYGFRPMKGQHQAVKQLLFYFRRGANVFLKLDLRKYFDSIDHELLLSLIEQRIPDKQFLSLARRMLRCLVVDNGRLFKPDAGVSQGSILSPLLANIFLDELDGVLQDNGYLVVRYADDIVIACVNHEEAKQAFSFVEAYLKKKRKISVNREKTKIIRGSVGFLGFVLDEEKVVPNDRAVSRLKERVQDLVSLYSGEDLVVEAGKTVRHWAAYYVKDFTDFGFWRALDRWISKAVGGSEGLYSLYAERCRLR